MKIKHGYTEWTDSICKLCVYQSSVGHASSVTIMAAPDFPRKAGAQIDGVSVNGVDMIKWDDEGRIVEFKVMIRPLKAINLIQQKMAALLQASL